MKKSRIQKVWGLKHWSLMCYVYGWWCWVLNLIVASRRWWRGHARSSGRGFYSIVKSLVWRCRSRNNVQVYWLFYIQSNWNSLNPFMYTLKNGQTYINSFITEVPIIETSPLIFSANTGFFMVGTSVMKGLKILWCSHMHVWRG